MPRPHVILVTCAAALLPVACQRAQRYPSPSAKPASKDQPLDRVAALPIWSWLVPEATPDVPMVFVAPGQPDWAGLPRFLNHFPPPAAGTRTLHLAQHPFAAAAALVAADRLEQVKLKVPRGLPDPTPAIPAANPPTFGKWKLGRKIFFDRKIPAGRDRYACADCHRPAHGFGEDRAVNLGGFRNTPALVNAVYNRFQYWDGRATALEEVVVRTLQDELPPAAPKLGRSAVETHRWGGLTNALEQSDDYRLLFKQVFGIARPTQDAVAKALATYMRTILAGDSLYDNAEEERRDRKASELTAAHFLPSLDAAALKSLGVEQESKQEVADRLGRGHRLFQAKGCAVCHPPPLFTDRDFHNVGIGESDAVPAAGAETGRFAHVPIGLKDARLIGAFKTPTLRGLPRTAPYFHTGSSRDLHSVVKYFDHSVPWNPSLAASLVGAGGTQARSLELSADDRRDLVLFLHALDGTPDPILAPPK